VGRDRGAMPDWPEGTWPEKTASHHRRELGKGLADGEKVGGVGSETRGGYRTNRDLPRESDLAITRWGGGRECDRMGPSERRFSGGKGRKEKLKGGGSSGRRTQVVVDPTA